MRWMFGFDCQWEKAGKTEKNPVASSNLNKWEWITEING